MKKKILFLAIISFFLPLLPVLAADTSFPDLPSSHENFTAINYLKNHAIIHGYPDGYFRPDQKINRAEALKIILLSSNYQFNDQSLNEIKLQIAEIKKIKSGLQTGQSTPDIATPDVGLAASDAKIATPNATINLPADLSDINLDYPDIAESHWFFPYVMKGSLLKIVRGYPDGSFKPENTVNLAETLKMITLTNEITLPQNIPGDPYQDVKKDAWFAPHVQYFKDYHLLESENGYLHPEMPITRGKLCELIYRFIKREEFKTKFNENGQNFIYGKATFYGEGDGFDGQGTASGEIFDKNKPTAAHLTLPFGTKIRVYSMEGGVENGKFVEVTITDRGPYDKRFILDLSSSSFEKLAPISRGFIDVKYEILEKP